MREPELLPPQRLARLLVGEFVPGEGAKNLQEKLNPAGFTPKSTRIFSPVAGLCKGEQAMQTGLGDFQLNEVIHQHITEMSLNEFMFN